MRTVRYAYVAVKTQVSGGQLSARSPRRGGLVAATDCVHPSGRLGGDPCADPKNPERAAITALAALLTSDSVDAGLLAQWITAGRSADLPYVHAFGRGPSLDIRAATGRPPSRHPDSSWQGVFCAVKAGR